MSDFKFILPSTSEAIVGSDEALHLFEQMQRVENSIAKNDPPLTLDTSKALLETTYKTILNDKGETLNASDDMNRLYKMVKDILPFSHDDEAKSMLEHLVGAIAHWVPQLRNKFGASSHGKDGHYISPIEMPEAKMVAHLVDGVSGFLLRKSRLLASPENSQRFYYGDYEEFNDYLDTSNDPVDLKINNSTPIPCSKVLFDCDCEAYKECLIQFNNQKEEEATLEISAHPELTEIVPVAENQQDQAEVIPNKQGITDE
ncbi:abortive infection family protein [Candidatus Babeliales bacterium]|nr:abortive infection family protein [Candidatus Babeliales bacterium]